eukprot:gene18093-34451_t
MIVGLVMAAKDGGQQQQQQLPAVEVVADPLQLHSSSSSSSSNSNSNLLTRRTKTAQHTDPPAVMGFYESIAIMHPIANKRTRHLSVEDMYKHGLNITPTGLLSSAQYLHRELPI